MLMTVPILSIGLPTYNRAALLDQQLAWLIRTLEGKESACEIIISDNHSTDDTPKITEKWQPAFAKTQLKLNRNSENIGAIRNIAYCINAATAQHVWVISDDDQIFDHTLEYVFNTLNEHSALALLILNFSRRDFRTDELDFQQCFSFATDSFHTNGKLIFERCLEQDYGGVTLTTALIYRTDLAQQALREWESGLDNLSVQTYITGFCALYGSAKVTQDTYLECSAGDHFFLKNPQLLHKLRNVDKPEMYARLAKIGYANLLQKVFWKKLWQKLNQIARHPEEFIQLIRMLLTAIAFRARS